jgi:hypothetical protein
MLTAAHQPSRLGLIVWLSWLDLRQPFREPDDRAPLASIHPARYTAFAKLARMPEMTREFGSGKPKSTPGGQM